MGVVLQDFVNHANLSVVSCLGRYYMNALQQERKMIELLLEKAKELYRDGKLEIESQYDDSALFIMDCIKIKLSPLQGARFIIEVHADGIIRYIEAGDIGDNYFIPWPSKLKRLAGYLYNRRQATVDSQRVCEAIGKILLEN